MAKNELKKCPCCKGPAIYNEDLNSFYAECHHCQLRTASYRTKERAAEIWNTRQDEWISVKDRLPEVGVDVFGCIKWCESGNRGVYILKTVDASDYTWATSDDSSELSYMLDVTHWKPITLPEVE